MPTIKFTQPARVESEHIAPLREIYFEAFPPEERGDYGEWLNEIAEGKRWLYLAELHRTLIGIASILPWVTADTHLLEYLATARDYRGKSYGAQLLQHVARSMRALGKASGIIWEAESDDHGSAAEKNLRRRRIAFYERNGAKVLECAPRYCTFNMRGGEPLKMKLMWLPLIEKAEPPRGEKLRDCVIGIHTLDYGRSADDPLTQAVMKDLVC